MVSLVQRRLQITAKTLRFNQTGWLQIPAPPTFLMEENIFETVIAQCQMIWILDMILETEFKVVKM